MINGQKIKQLIRNIFYEVIIFLLKFNFFKKILNIFVSVYFIDKGYCFDFPYLIGKSSSRQLFKGEQIFLSKFDNLKLKNCIDVGCNIGEFSKEILKNKNTKVIAFEPLPACQENLKKIYKEYNKRFMNFECALSNKDGFDYINFGDKKSGLASLEKSINNIDYVGKSNKNTLKIEIKKLDNYIDYDNFKNIDFIKIDTEGHEFKVLEGGLDFINKNNIKIIQIEFNWHHLFTNNTIYQFSNILDNYVVTQLNLINGKLIPRDKNHYFSNIFMLSNFIFVEKQFFMKNKNLF